MGYSREIYDEAMAMVNANRTKAIEECNLRKAAFYEQYPRAAEIETELATTAIQAARAVLNGAETKKPFLTERTHAAVTKSRTSRNLFGAFLCL